MFRVGYTGCMAMYRLCDDPDTKADGWTNFASSEPAFNADRNQLDESRKALKSTISDLISSESLVVLTGLGTSLEVKAPGKSESLFPTMADLWKAVEESDKKTFEAATDLVQYDKEEQNIEHLLSLCDSAIRLGLGDTKIDLKAFKSKAENIICDLCSPSLNDVDMQCHRSFLERVAQRPANKSRADLFTTNYDLCFERAAGELQIPVVDGFTLTPPYAFSPEVFDYDIVTKSEYASASVPIPRLLRLYKLHGSINWRKIGDSIRRMETEGERQIIYPRSDKFEVSYRQPFFEMMSRFQLALRRSSLGLLVVGFGFSDSHIVEPIMSAIRSNPGLRLVVVSPNLCTLDAVAMRKNADAKGLVVTNNSLSTVANLSTALDARLTLVNTDMKGLVGLLPFSPLRSTREIFDDRYADSTRSAAASIAAAGGA